MLSREQMVARRGQLVTVRPNTVRAVQFNRANLDGLHVWLPPGEWQIDGECSPGFPLHAGRDTSLVVFRPHPDTFDGVWHAHPDDL